MTLWTVACQAPLSKGFSTQEKWSGLPCPPPGDLPNPGIEPVSPASPALAGRFFVVFLIFFPLVPPGHYIYIYIYIFFYGLKCLNLPHFIINVSVNKGNMVICNKIFQRKVKFS